LRDAIDVIYDALSPSVIANLKFWNFWRKDKRYVIATYIYQALKSAGMVE